MYGPNVQIAGDVMRFIDDKKRKIRMVPLGESSVKVNLSKEEMTSLLEEFGFHKIVTSKKYGKAWKRIRDKFISLNPTCKMCGAPATEVHHIVPVNIGGANHSRENLMAVCHECHAAIHEKN